MQTVIPSRVAVKSDQLRKTCNAQLDESLKSLPENVSIANALAWFETCQWNTRAQVLAEMAEAMREACTKAGHKCTLTQGRAHLAEVLGKSERTVWRLLIRRQHRVVPRNGAR
jgi:translation initiation factor 2B subunit (eIF-2B alpha/beta/delta family)